MSQQEAIIISAALTPIVVALIRVAIKFVFESPKE